MSEVLVIAEHRRGELREVSFEAITAGREVANGFNASLGVVVIGGNSKQFARQLNCENVDTVYRIPGEDEFNHTRYYESIISIANERDISGVIIPHTVNGLDYAPAIASRLDSPIITDVTSIEFDDEIILTRELHGSKLETDIAVTNGVPIITTRSTEWEQTRNSGSASIQEYQIDSEPTGVTVRGYEDVLDGDIDISQADVLVSIGRGIEDEENLDLIRELVEAIDGTLSASRPVVDNGWLPDNRQVGQSGKVVTPDVYLAIGISGAVQHVAGMKGADTIIAINNDPNAPIFDIADYGVVDDLFEVVPSLINQFE